MRRVHAHQLQLAKAAVSIELLGGIATYAEVSERHPNYGHDYQLARKALCRKSASAENKSRGDGQDADVSTPAGAISAIPLGLSYLILAPFPWQLASLRQIITLPEMLVWWFSLPLLVLGLWFTIKYKLREIAPILIFTTLLTLTYSVLQGNVGTAYRQRAQLLVFYFVFIAVGFILMKEKREASAQRRMEEGGKSRGRLRWEDRAGSKDLPVAG